MVAQENDNVDNTDKSALPDDNPCDVDDALLETDVVSIDNGEEPVQQNNNGVAITTDRTAVQSRMSSISRGSDSSDTESDDTEPPSKKVKSTTVKASSGMKILVL